MFRYQMYFTDRNRRTLQPGEQMTTAASTSQHASSTMMAGSGSGLGSGSIVASASSAAPMTTPSSSAVRALGMEYKSLQEEPVEGFRVKLINDDNLFEWEVAIFGPPDTLYQGGYFKAHMKFPHDYPYSPPSIRFLTKVWHPNVYENGDLCISILHPPVDDPQSGELPCERWNPTQNVRTILLSVISLLNEPNTFSPANVDASVMYRRWRDSQDNEYPNIIRKQALAANAEAKREGIVVPTTLEDYCLKPTRKPTTESANFYDDDFDLETEDDLPTDDDDFEDDDDEEEDEDDSATASISKNNGDSKCNNNGLGHDAAAAGADDAESADDSGKGETT
ncbi:ubiquitin-conjugating enzyme E2 R2 isoform X2 [Drosophila bipectinata]|uniref:ubiquitin-conjugating enzyme E2 R2 isoform X2 n=1 Tax=Drosophila bipectinata TaxID=42026 RepID=UPI001C89A116|nr:ubiquitin-conjugating enzyme E2 R2 isoform X2 [Drosophila bipectinata]